MTRFICSHDRAEVELVKKELFLAGIRSEIRNNPLAQALRVTRLELWLEDERDLFNASKLYAGWQARNNGRSVNSNGHNGKVPIEGYLELEDPDGKTGDAPFASSKGGAEVRAGGGGELDEVAQASAALENEIEEILERERELREKCGSLRHQAEELGEGLAKAEADLAREAENRAALEKQHSAQVSELQKALECERAERARLAEQLGGKEREFRDQLKGRDDALNLAQKKLDTALAQQQTQQMAVVELRKEIVSLEAQREEHEKAVAKAQAQALLEREARLAAEEKAREAATVQKSLEEQLVEEKELQRHAYAQSLNALRSKLQAKRNG